MLPLSLTARSPLLGTENAIPIVGFGTYLLPPEETKDAVVAALAAGYTHIDTAEGYRNEAEVGAALRESGKERDEIFVTTKVWPGNPAWGQSCKDFGATVAACEASLARMELEYVDLYLIHAPFAAELRLQQWRALLELQRRGLSRWVGVSNYSAAHLREIYEAELPMPACNQLELHPFCLQVPVLDYMAEHGVAPIAYSSLAPLAEWRVQQASGKQARGAVMADCADTLESLAAKYGATQAQVLLRWALQMGFPVLPKSRSVARIQENSELFHFAIDEGDMETLTSLDQGCAVAWAPGDPVAAL